MIFIRNTNNGFRFRSQFIDSDLCSFISIYLFYLPVCVYVFVCRCVTQTHSEALWYNLIKTTRYYMCGKRAMTKKPQKVK